MIQLIVALILGLFFVVYLTIIEAHYYDYVYRHKLSHADLHPILTLMRIVFLSVLIWLMGYTLEWYELIAFGFICLCSFNFFHEGVFYTTRHYLAPNIYEKKWWAEKHEDSVDRENQSKTNSPVWLRTSLFGLALITLGFLIYDKI